MKLSSQNMTDGQPLAEEFAFGRIDPASHVALADNRNPHLAWDDAPAGTQSFVITCIDPDVPTKPDDVNQEGRQVPADLPRTEFVHWLIADIPADVMEIAAGACSDGVTPRGKANPAGPAGTVQGGNDYTGWFAGDADMAGTYLGAARRALDEATRHLQERSYRHTGHSLSHVDVLQHRLGVLWTKYQAARAYVQWASRQGDTGGDEALPALIASKAHVGDAAVDIVNECMTLVGGRGYAQDGVMARMLRDVRAVHVMSPTTDLLYTWAGRALLDLPLLGE